jgi:hypothetical protein
MIVIAVTVAAVTGSLVYGRRIKHRISRFDGVGFFLLAIVLFAAQTFSIKAMTSIGSSLRSLRVRSSWRLAARFGDYRVYIATRRRPSLSGPASSSRSLIISSMVDANTFRLTSEYPYVERKIESLKRCFDEVGLWEGALQASLGVRHA